MHEMSITMHILEIVRGKMRKNGVEKLKNLKIKIGEVTAIEPESLRFCFEAAISDTPLEGAVLDIEEVPLAGRCNNCGAKFRMDFYLSTPCPGCGGRNTEMTAGRELEIVSMEVE